MLFADEVVCVSTETLAKKTVVLGITGSIAAVRTIELAHELIRRGATVQGVMTEGAQRIIHPDAVECATGNPVITRWTGRVPWVEYCADGGSGDLLLIAPCTAATIGKIAHGIPDTLVSIFAATAIGSGMPVVIAPAMCMDMYSSIVRANIEILLENGVTIVGPVIEEGKAKIAGSDDIVRWVERTLSGSALDGRRVIITGGATAEPIDPVRMITSRASGKMGTELAFEAFRRGADVTLVHRGHTGFTGIQEIYVETAEDMIDAVINELEKGYDILLSAAAISDYTLDPSRDKIESGAQLTLNLRPTEKLLEAVRSTYPEITVVGFKLETASGDTLIKRAKEAMTRYGLDMVVANTVKSMGREDGEVWIIDNDHGIDHVSGAKSVIASEIFDRISGLPEQER
ncbi:bifunctional phosphopantothenoylcysteine decarboxylase/phosphopantothenate--cysteine ligase CoaBC [ANME-2 cluster archaeon]|nr:MAG: bifunctional phosphopantothenoylcysteine decarboxylase/phosphopantothenate--cysteine ligase CoaBC [ANME-2 cluster archaeon]